MFDETSAKNTVCLIKSTVCLMKHLQKYHMFDKPSAKKYRMFDETSAKNTVCLMKHLQKIPYV
jgi:hypothetical protein